MIGIKGMDMPGNCAICKFHVDAIRGIYCGITGSNIGTTVACYEKMKDCPLVNIKENNDELTRD